MARNRVPEAVTATINLAGEYKPLINSHDCGPGSHVTVRIGLTMVTFMEQCAANIWANAWNRRFSGHLGFETPMPEQRPMALADAADVTIGLSIHARSHEPLGFEVRDFDPFVLRFGPVTWVAHDEAARRTVGEAFAKAAQLGAIILPVRYY